VGLLLRAGLVTEHVETCSSELRALFAGIEKLEVASGEALFLPQALGHAGTHERPGRDPSEQSSYHASSSRNCGRMSGFGSSSGAICRESTDAFPKPLDFALERAFCLSPLPPAI
jgi:hypothetical protein